MRRQLRFFDLLCLGINGIVGSGIFLIPGRLQEGLGAASFLMFPLCGILLVSVGLSFAEASSYFPRNGGPYNYARAAFGPWMGFGVNWISWVAGVFSNATVAVGLPAYLATFWPAASSAPYAPIISTIVVGFFTALNIRGIRAGATATNILTMAKLVPLALLLAFGLPQISLGAFTPFAPHGFSPAAGLLLAVLFTYQGFEVIPVPAGEAADAERTVPRALIWSLLGCAALYTLVQLVVIGAGVPAAGAEQPLAVAAAQLIGPWGAMVVSIGAVISMTGFCAGSPIINPRYLTVLAEDKFLPAALAAEHPRYGSPMWAILLSSGVALAFVYTLNFDALVDMSGFAVGLQYLLTCVALPLLRRQQPARVRSIAQQLAPFIGVAVTLVFLVQVGPNELRWSAIAIGAGVMIGALGYRQRKRTFDTSARP